MDETAQLIAEQKKNLPRELIEAIEGVAWEHLVEEIGEENSLKAEQIEALERETMLVLYAFESPENYIDNIIGELGISEDSAITIAESITNKIFDPILSKISNYQTQNNSTAPLPEIAAEIHPMIEEGERVHNAIHNSIGRPDREPILITNEEEKERELGHTSRKWTPDYVEEKPIEPADSVSVPDYRYPDGADPYREPSK